MINHDNMDVFIFPLVLKYPQNSSIFDRTPYNMKDK